MPRRIADPAISATPAAERRLPARGTALAAAALAGTALLAAGCSGSSGSFAPPCPSLALLQDAADLTRFTDRGQDVTDMVVNARLIGIRGACSPGDTSRQVDARFQVSMTLTRGPALAGRSVSVPYLVTVAEGTRILDQKDYAVATSFPPNVDSTTVTDAEIPLVFPVTPQKTAAAYTVYVSFRLTPQELAYNRARAAAAARVR